MGDDFKSRLDAVRARIERAARRAGRDPSGVALVAVSKSVPVERLREAAACGCRVFGENRVQETLAKMEVLGAGAGAHDSGRHDAGTVHGHVGRLRSGGGGRRHAGAHRDGAVRAAPCRVEARAGGAWSRSRSLAAGTWVRPCWPVSWRTE